MKKKYLLPFALLLMAATEGPSGCDAAASTDNKVSQMQAQTLAEAQAQVGMPEIVNFQEKRMMKMIYEMRDQTIATHSYIVNQMSGCLVYLGASVGYGIPYATQYSNPMVTKTFYQNAATEHPQAEPNGLFMPAEAHGTWVMLKDPTGDSVKPVYIEPDVIVSPFRLTARECR